MRTFRPPRVQGHRGTEVVTMLVAEDEPDMRALIRVSLDLAPLDVAIVAEATDGREAIELFERLSPKPDVVVLDLRMPDLSGLEVAAQLRAHHPSLPIIIFTAFHDPDTAAAADSLGVLCISKRHLADLPAAIVAAVSRR